MVGGVAIAGPPAPVALVLNAATATTAAVSKSCERADVETCLHRWDLRELELPCGHTVARSCEQNPTGTSGFRKGVIHTPLRGFAGESRIRDFRQA